MKMINPSNLEKAWAILDARERRNAWIVLGFILANALGSAVMVASIIPFLTVLADPSLVQTTPVLSWAFDQLGFSSTYAFLGALGLASFVIMMFTYMLQVLKIWATSRFAMLRVHTISRRLLANYLSQPYAFFLNHHSGEMGPKILSEAEQVVSRFLLPAADIAAALLSTLAIMALLLWFEPIIAAIAFVVVGGIYGCVYLFARQALRQLGRTRMTANRQRFRFAGEALAGIKDIKLLNKENAYLSRYDEPSLLMAQTQVKIAIFSQIPPIAIQSLAFGGVIILCMALIDPNGVTSGSTLSDLLPTIGVFAFSGQRMMPEFNKLYQSLALLQTGSAAVSAVYDDLFDHAPLIASNGHRSDRLAMNTGLQLDQISYSYPNAALASVHNISLSISAGQRIGIIGSSGAGKTTLVDITLGLLVPDQGSLIVDSTKITAANLRSWMMSVGYVPQDIFLIDATIDENIALGVPNGSIDHKRVREAARIAKIDNFICSELPAAYETQVGERGVRLSGGQRQRLGIARALYRDADLIVFDEATSALDNLTEAEVMTAISAIPKNRTTLIVAHRLSTVRHCDKIIVLERGKLVGFDSWENLMSENSTFQRLARMSEREYQNA